MYAAGLSICRQIFNQLHFAIWGEKSTNKLKAMNMWFFCYILGRKEKCDYLSIKIYNSITNEQICESYSICFHNFVTALKIKNNDYLGTIHKLYRGVFWPLLIINVMTVVEFFWWIRWNSKDLYNLKNIIQRIFLILWAIIWLRASEVLNFSAS